MLRSHVSDKQWFIMECHEIGMPYSEKWVSGKCVPIFPVSLLKRCRVPFHSLISTGGLLKGLCFAVRQGGGETGSETRDPNVAFFVSWLSQMFWPRHYFKNFCGNKLNLFIRTMQYVIQRINRTEVQWLLAYLLNYLFLTFFEPGKPRWQIWGCFQVQILKIDPAVFWKQSK